MRTVAAVIIGSGFGGLATAKQLAKSKIETVLISATPEHLFAPLLYQVATGVLESTEIAPPIAGVLYKHKTISVVNGAVIGIDTQAKVVTYSTATGVEQIRYGSLVVAAGASQAYFGHDEFAEFTYSLKTIDDARALRTQIHDAFTRGIALAHGSNVTHDPNVADGSSVAIDAAPQSNLTFVVVGAGPTGVEVAGQIRELGRRYFKVAADVHVIEGAGDVLPFYGGKLSRFARETLEDAGVTVHVSTFVTAIDAVGVTVRDETGTERRIDAATIVWSAGVKANPLAAVLAAETGCATDRAGRLLINDDLTVGTRSDVFAIGDMTSLNGYPGQSPVAMQEGRHAADIIRGRRSGGAQFAYVDKGSMAVINRFNAVCDLHGPFKITGFVAWVLWLALHLFYLVGHRSRTAAVTSWLVAFIGRGRPGFAEDSSRNRRELMQSPGIAA